MSGPVASGSAASPPATARHHVPPWDAAAAGGTPMRVLLIEDDDELADLVGLGLRREHLAVDHAATFQEAVDHLVATSYDIACLDLGLPDGDGLDLCDLMHRGEVRRPHRVLVLTARDAVADRVAGLDAGADDYLVKPFSIAELAARIRALARPRRRAPHHPGGG